MDKMKIVKLPADPLESLDEVLDILEDMFAEEYAKDADNFSLWGVGNEYSTDNKFKLHDCYMMQKLFPTLH